MTVVEFALEVSVNISQLGGCEFFVVSDGKTSQMWCILTVETVENRRPISHQEVP